MQTSNPGETDTLATTVRNAVLALQPQTDSGVAVAVLAGGQVAFVGGFGLRDREAGLPVDAQTCFAIGSATKAFTSMMLSMLDATRAISLDQPVTNYLPDFVMQDGKASTDMTLVDILSHRTGLPRHDPLWYLGPFSRAQLFYRVRHLAPVPGAFRTRFLYNNIMYTLAGHLMERQSGTRWEELLRTRVLAPLGLLDTTTSLAELLQNPNHAKGYKRSIEVPLKDLENIGPAGGINANVTDLAKWVQLFLGRGVTPDGTRLIDEARLDRMCEGIIDTGIGRTRYGMGWYVGEILGNRYVFHNGTADGNTAHISFVPERGLGVVVLTNQHCTQELVGVWPDSLVEQIYDHLVSSPPTGHVVQPGTAGLDLDPLPPASPALGGPVGGHVGLFSEPGYGDIVIGTSGSGLSISYYDKTWPLLPQGGDNFAFVLHAFATDYLLPVTFVRGIDGAIVALQIRLVREVGAMTFVKR